MTATTPWLRHITCWSALPILVIVGALAGCRNPSATPPAEEIDILCGSSFQAPMEQLAKEFKEETGITATLQIGGSEDHLPKVKDQIIGDIFVTHDPYLDLTKDAGSWSDDVRVGSFGPVLVTAKGNPENIHEIKDLARPGLRVVLTDPKYSTCGEIVYELLDKREAQTPGIKQKVLENVGNALVRSHSTVSTHIKVGSADAGIMWNGVAATWKEHVDVIPTDDFQGKDKAVWIIGLSFSKKPEKVEKFMEFVRERGPALFEEFGYLTPTPAETTTEQPAVEEPATTEPAVEQPAVDQPAVDPSVIDPPAIEGPVLEEPARETPTATEPTALDPSKGPVLLFCGAGLRPPVAEIIELFKNQTGVEVQTEWAGSETLLTRLTLTKRGDLYMPGDLHYVDMADEKGLVQSKTGVCRMIPVIITPKGNPKNIETLADMAKPGMKLGLGRDDVTAIGRKCAKIFTTNGVDYDAIKANTVFESMTVNELLTQAKLATVDAAIVWDGLASMIADDIEIVPIPPEQNSISEVGVGLLKSSESTDAANRFIQLMTSPEGRAIFKKHGYALAGE